MSNHGFSPEELAKIRAAAKNFEDQKAAWGVDKLEVFEQLLRLPAFTEWAKDNIIVNRDVDHIQKEVRIMVIYKGEYEGNKTSLQKLAQIKELVCGVGADEDIAFTKKMTKGDLAVRIMEIIDFDPTQSVPLEDIITEGEEDDEGNTQGN